MIFISGIACMSVFTRIYSSLTKFEQVDFSYRSQSLYKENFEELYSKEMTNGSTFTILFLLFGIGSC